MLCIDETGDRKKGTTTDYVASPVHRQRPSGWPMGIVSVNAYGVLGTDHLPAWPSASTSRKRRLKPGDVFQTQATDRRRPRSRQLQALGFRFAVVLADSLYGESRDFTTRTTAAGICPMWWRFAATTLSGLFRANTSATPTGAPIARVFTDGTSEQRFVREIHLWQALLRCATTSSPPIPYTQPQETTCYAHDQPARATLSSGSATPSGLRTWIRNSLNAND